MAKKEFITLPRRTGLAKLGAAKSARYYYRRTGGVAVEMNADVAQLARTFESHPKMRMRVYPNRDSQHVIVVADTKHLQHGYVLTF